MVAYLSILLLITAARKGASASSRLGNSNVCRVGHLRWREMIDPFWWGEGGWGGRIPRGNTAGTAISEGGRPAGFVCNVMYVVRASLHLT